MILIKQPTSRYSKTINIIELDATLIVGFDFYNEELTIESLIFKNEFLDVDTDTLLIKFNNINDVDIIEFNYFEVSIKDIIKLVLDNDLTGDEELNEDFR